MNCDGKTEEYNCGGRESIDRKRRGQLKIGGRGWGIGGGGEVVDGW